MRSAQVTGHTRKTDAELRSACDVLGYEHGSLQDAAIVCMQANSLGLQAVRNAALESVAVHTRLLIEFFYNATTKDYVRAEQFFDHREVWRDCCATESTMEWATGKNGRISVRHVEQLSNDSVAHFTWTRIKSPRPEWHLRPLLLHFDALMNRFLEQAPAQRVTLQPVGSLPLPATPDGLIALVRRYRTATYHPQSTHLPIADTSAV